jgi:hypothetical protein
MKLNQKVKEKYNWFTDGNRRYAWARCLCIQHASSWLFFYQVIDFKEEL